MPNFPSHTVVTNLGYQLTISHQENRRSYLKALCMCGNAKIYATPTLTTCCNKAICPSCFKNAKERRISMLSSGIKVSIFFRCPWCKEEKSYSPYRVMKLMGSEDASKISSLKIICPVCPQTELSLDKIDAHILLNHNNIKPTKKKNVLKQLYYRECLSTLTKPDAETKSLSSSGSFLSAVSSFSPRSDVRMDGEDSG